MAAFSKQALGMRASGGLAASALGSMTRMIAPLAGAAGFVGTVRGIEKGD